MEEKKIPLKDILAAIDTDSKTVWKELTDEQKKNVPFWILNRYVANVNSDNLEKQAMAVLRVNKYYNKNWAAISKHPELLWQLLCISGKSDKIEFHKWLGLKSHNNKKEKKIIKLLKELLPTEKTADIELRYKLSSEKEIINFIKSYGIDAKF